VLTEGAVIERIRRESPLPLHPSVLNAGFIYSPVGREVLGGIYRQYLHVAVVSNLPVLILSPTWRASPDRLAEAGLSARDVNGDAVKFLLGLKEEFTQAGTRVLVGGLMGCRGDAYEPAEGMARDAAASYHREQAHALVEGGADFLLASTLPALPEAVGIGTAMARAGLPYVLSFVIRPDGALLDGTSLGEALTVLDAHLTPRPVGYLFNCVHPVHVRRVLIFTFNYSRALAARILGLQGNASKKSPKQLDGSRALDSQDPEGFARDMLALKKEFGLKILGGCCGTNQHHMLSIARLWRQSEGAHREGR
jgi:homocysteine S-methyltransferase